MSGPVEIGIGGPGPTKVTLESGGSVIADQIEIDIQTEYAAAWLANTSSDVSIPSDVDAIVDGVKCRLIGTGRVVLAKGEHGLHLTGGTGGIAGIGVRMSDVWEDYSISDIVYVEVILYSLAAGTYSRYGTGLITEGGGEAWGIVLGHYGWSDTDRRTQGGAAVLAKNTLGWMTGDNQYTYISPCYLSISSSFTFRTAACLAVHYGNNTQPSFPTNVGDEFTGAGLSKPLAGIPGLSIPARTVDDLAGGFLFFDTRGTISIYVQKIRLTRVKAILP